MKEIVILGLKDKETGELRVYDVDNNQGRRNKHLPVQIGGNYILPIVAPYPFQHFSSLDASADYWSKYDKAYLKVESNISEEEYQGMRGSGIVYYRFKNRGTTILSEVQNPFEIAFNYYKEFGDSLGTHDLTTWVIHDIIRSPKEREFGVKILWEGIEKTSNRGYTLDISLDKYTLNYLDELIKMVDSKYPITFGRHGKIDITEDMLNEFDLDMKTIIKLNRKIRGQVVLKHKNFKKGKTMSSEEEHNLYLRLIEELPIYGDTVKLLDQRGFDVDKIFKLHFEKKMEVVLKYEEDEEGNKYKTYYDYLNDSRIKNYEYKTSPYDYYCCEDCEGFDIHDMYTEEELEGSTYIRNERADCIVEAITDYVGVITLDNNIFKSIDKDIMEIVSNTLSEE